MMQTVTCRDERERLIAEQALLAYRAVCEAAQGASPGRGMEAMEDAVLERGREQQRKMLEAAARSVSGPQKGGRAARAAAAWRPTSGSGRGR